jgi:hypothetical protein
MTRKDNWQALYADWQGYFKRYVKSHRGTAAAIARHLGVSRQTVHRWCGYQKIPGWAVYAIQTTVQLGGAKMPEPDTANGNFELKAPAPVETTAPKRIVRLGSDKPDPIRGAILDRFGKVATGMACPFGSGGISCKTCRMIVRHEKFGGTLNTGGLAGPLDSPARRALKSAIREAMAA